MLLTELKELQPDLSDLVDLTATTYTLIQNEQDLPLHYHHQMEIVAILAGQSTFQIDLKKYPVSAGDFLLIPRGALHASTATTTTCTCQVVDFDLHLLDHNYLDNCQMKFLNPLLNDGIEITAHIVPTTLGYSEITQIFNQLVHIERQKPYGFELAIRAQLFLLFYTLFHYQLASEKNEPLTATTEKLSKLKQVITHIHENFHSALTIQELAASIDYSEYHFMRFFKSQTGITCGEYIQQYRLQQAAELLRTSTLSITDIAYECGFEHSAYFSTCFKKKYIITPRAYRQKFTIVS